jgi:hypothetical protein
VGAKASAYRVLDEHFSKPQPGGLDRLQNPLTGWLWLASTVNTSLRNTSAQH